MITITGTEDIRKRINIKPDSIYLIINEKNLESHPCFRCYGWHCSFSLHALSNRAWHPVMKTRPRSGKTQHIYAHRDARAGHRPQYHPSSMENWGKKRPHKRKWKFIRKSILFIILLRAERMPGMGTFAEEIKRWRGTAPGKGDAGSRGTFSTTVPDYPRTPEFTECFSQKPDRFLKREYGKTSAGLISDRKLEKGRFNWHFDQSLSKYPHWAWKQF